MSGRRSTIRDVIVLVVVIAVAVPVIVVAAKALGGGEMRPVESPAATGVPVAAGSPTGPPQTCTSCWVDKGAPAPAVKGETAIEDGVQILRVGLVGGYYRPNRFTAQAGLPVTVEFTGRAQDCLAHPEFPELGVKGDMSSGRAVFPLGELKPGTYTFTCSMGVNEGRITVQ
jgi:hypothetical protein